MEKCLDRDSACQNSPGNLGGEDLTLGKTKKISRNSHAFGLMPMR